MANETAPASVGDVLGAAGEPATVRWRDRDYRVGPPTTGAITRAEMLVAKAAGSELDALRGQLPDAQFRKLDTALTAKLLARAHRAGGELFNEVMGSPDGQVLYLLALLREHHPDLNESDARGMMAEVPEQVERALILVTPDFLRLVGKMKGADPRKVQAVLDQLSPSTGS